ncbi:phosphatase PAP2 family protein [Leptospira sp. WS92.C1]
MSRNTDWFQDPFWFGQTFLESLRGTAFDPLFGFLTLGFHYLGGNLFFMSILSITYLLFDRKLGIRLAAGLLTSGMINGIVKALFESPRPSLSWNGPGTLTEASYGFPSGHVQSGVVLWGLIFMHVRSKTIRSFALFIILFMPFSRMYAGVHFPGDVLGGLVLGLCGLIFVEILFRSVPELENPGMFSGQTLSNTKTISLLIVVITLPAVLLYSAADADEKIKSYEQVISASGALGGFAIGILLSKFNSIDWKRADSFREVSRRIGVLLLGILVFYFLPGFLTQKFFPENPVARYLRYGIVSSYIGFFSVYILFLWKRDADLKK